MKVNFSVNLTAADSNARTLSVRIVTFGDKGNTSVGPTIFAADSLKFNKTTKLLLEHDRTRPIGKLLTYSIHDEGIDATFKVAGTIAGDDSLLEASEGLRDGFSVGAFIEDYKVVDGVMQITAARIQEVSLVTDPAIQSARVEKVAATENIVPSDSNPNNSETKEVSDNTTEGEPVSDTTVPAPADEAVEAAKVEPTIVASAPVAHTKLRSPINSPASYLEHSVRAALGDDLSRQYVQAASDTTTTEVAGLVPTPQLSTIWDPKTTNVRPSISAIRTATLPAAGMTFEIPRVKTAPTVAEAAEKGAFSDTQVEIEYLSVSVKKYAGMQKFDVEVLDRTSPAFFDELVRLMANAYAKATDTAVATAIQAGTLDSTVITLPFDGDEFAGFISRGAASIYNATKRFPTGIVVTPDQWGALIALTDSSKRPLFNVAGSPTNALGSIEPGSPAGTVMGLPVYVDPFITGTGDDSIIMVNRDSFVWYEGAGPLQLRTNIVGTGQVEVGYYGYGATATLTAGGAFTLNQSV
jgi:HK97 family phage major capsid protein